MAQTKEQLEATRELANQYGLTGADFYQHQQSKSYLITRTGIEKIQYGAGITVSFEAIKAEAEFAAVKASATRSVKKDGATKATTLSIETFGSACKANSRVNYYLEMAEKRALSRAVLKLADFYQLGVYGEDEMPPAHPDEPAKPVAEPAPVMRAVTNSAAPVASTGSGPSTPEGNPLADSHPPVQCATASQKEEIIRLLNHQLITRQEKTKMLLNINRLDEERATQAIAKLRKAIEDREGTTSLAQ